MSLNNPHNKMRGRPDQPKSRKKPTWEEAHYLVQIILKELTCLNSRYSQALLIALYASCHPIMTTTL